MNLHPRRSFRSQVEIFRPQINGKPAKMYTAIYMHRGDILTFGGARTGTRGYIAFSSYLDVPVVMGKPFYEYQMSDRWI